MRVNIVVAMGLNHVIGVDNEMPWHLPQDLKHFKDTTMGYPMIMGRLTYESIGRPLPGRKTIVVTRDPSWVTHADVTVAHDLDAAFREAEVAAKRMGVGQVMVVGGAKIYQQTIERVDFLYVTEVHVSCEGDAYFPEVSPALWRETARQDFLDETPGSLSYSFVEYSKITNG